MTHLEDSELRALLSSLSHDLRNPLAAIVTNLEYSRRVLSRAQADSEVAEAIHDSVAACELVRRMLANLELLAKGRELRTTLVEVDLVAATQDALRRNEKHAAQSEIALHFTKLVDRARALIDRELFALALDNLVANSLQHAPRGSTVEVSVEAREANGAQVVLRDAGPVIPPELREQALAPQSHMQQNRTPETRYGRGLGLLAARAAAAGAGVELDVGGDERGSRMSLLVTLLP